MTCLNCKHEFHWLTGETWRGYDADYGAPVHENRAHEFLGQQRNFFAPNRNAAPFLLGQIFNLILGANPAQNRI